MALGSRPSNALKQAQQGRSQPLGGSRGPVALQSLQQFRKRCFEGRGDLAECSQSRLACATLQIGDVDFVDAGLLGKVNLSPVPGAAQLPDSLAGRRTDVLCHASMIGLAFALYLVRTLFGV